MNNSRLPRVLAALTLALLACATSRSFASITTYPLSINLTNVSPGVGGQLFVDVLDASQAALDYSGLDITTLTPNAEVLFVFRNTSVIASSITDIYFDDGALMGIAALYNTLDPTGAPPAVTGLNFSLDASPGNLPGGNNASPDFVASGANFRADSSNPAAGVNASNELMGIAFSLQSGKLYADVIAALTAGLSLPAIPDDADHPEALRIGVHVQSITGGSSDSYINTGPGPGAAVVPEVASVLVWSLLMGTIGLSMSRRRDRQAAA